MSFGKLYTGMREFLSALRDVKYSSTVRILVSAQTRASLADNLDMKAWSAEAWVIEKALFMLDILQGS